MAKRINLTVVTPVKTFFEGQVSAVSLPSLDGEIGIMAGHSPLVFALKPGVAKVRIDEDNKVFVVSEGYAEIGPNMALVVCDAAELAEDIDVNRMVESYKESLKNCSNKNTVKRVLADETARRAGYVKDSTKALARAKARMHFIETYGSEAQKQRLEVLKERLQNS